jgi:hypothetical protein
MKAQIKKAVKFGNSGAHIIMGMEDLDKKFLVLSESSKWLLDDVLGRYHESLEEHVNPKLSDFLSKAEFESVKKAYLKLLEEKIKGYNSGIYKKFLRSDYESLKSFRVSNIGTILTDIENALPKKLKSKLIKEFYKRESH